MTFSLHAVSTLCASLRASWVASLRIGSSSDASSIRRAGAVAAWGAAWRHIVGALAAMMIGVTSASAGMVNLIVEDGQLVGATGLMVGEQTFDVEFVDGSCIELFNGCDSNGDFVFGSVLDALDAARALIDQVLIDTAVFSFNSNPETVFGCDDATICRGVIPLELPVSGLINGFDIRNYADNSLDNIFNITALGVSTSTAFNDQFTYIRFSLSTDIVATSTSEVPLPGGLLLMLSGLIGGMGLRRRQSSTAYSS